MENRYDFIDGLKGYGAIGVVFYHYILTFASFGFIGWNSGISPENQSSYYFENFPYSLISNTSFLYISIAVIALLPTLNFFKKGNADWIKKEALVRYFRFLPSIALCTLIAYVFNALGLFYNQESSVLTGFNWSNAFYVGDMSFLNALKTAFYGVLFQGDSTFNTVFWVMQVVFIGSYLSYFVIAFFGKLKKRYLVYIALLLISLSDPFYSLFLAGIIAGDILSHCDNKKIGKYGILLVALGFIFANFPKVILNCEIIRCLFYSMSAFCFILAAGTAPWLRKILSLKVFTYCGRNSFSLILTHSFVLFSFSCYTFVEFYESLGYGLSLFLTFLLAIPMNYIATELFSRAITKPTRYLCTKVYNFINS